MSDRIRDCQDTFIPQPASVSELRKVHNQKLVSAFESDRMPITLIAIDTLRKFVFSEKRQKLCEDCLP